MPRSFSVHEAAAASGAGNQEPPGVLVDGVDVLRKLGCCAKHLPVHIDLPLVPGAVAYPDWPAVLPAGEVIEFALGQVMLTADAEHDLQAHMGADRRRCGGCHELEEVARLVGAGRHPERLHGEAGVAHPGLSVVPVPLTANDFRQRGCHRGDDGTAGLEGQTLQHSAAGPYQIPPGPVVRLMDVRPRLPVRHRGVDSGCKLRL
jgi:hypothetical protein